MLVFLVYRLLTFARSLSLFSVLEGKCIASTSIAAPPSIQPPNDAQKVADAAWSWKRLHAVCVEEVCPRPSDPRRQLIPYQHHIFLACASESWTTALSDPTSEAKQSPRTRVAAMRCALAHDRDSCSHDERLRKIGEWILEAPCESVGLLLDGSGAL